MSVAEANTEEAAFGKREIRMHDVVAATVTALAIVPRIEEGPAVSAIARAEHGDKTENDDYNKNDGDSADRKLAVPQHRKYRNDADHRGAQVGLRFVDECKRH